jgi:hypothetical protein
MATPGSARDPAALVKPFVKFERRKLAAHALGFFDSIFNSLSDVGAAIHIIEYLWVE